jgi:hypothetical protein
MDTKTRKFAIKEAIKLVGTQNMENKVKAVFDLADLISSDLDSFENPNNSIPVPMDGSGVPPISFPYRLYGNSSTGSSPNTTTTTSQLADALNSKT